MEDTLHSRLITVVILLFAIAGSLWAGQDGVMKSAGVSRTITDFGGPFRTNKLEANGVSLITGPGAEFLMEIDYKGQSLFLSPGDFEARGVSTDKYTEELRTTFELMCKDKDTPIIAKLRYHRDQNACYIQKSLEIRSYKPMPGAILRSVILEDLVFKPEFVPVTPRDWSAKPEPGLDASARFGLGTATGIAAYDSKSKTGVFFFMDSPFGRESFGVNGSLQMREDVYVPLDKGYQSGRATIGSATGPPELAFKRLREYLWSNSCALRSRAAVATPKIQPLDWASVKPQQTDPPATGARAEACLKLCGLRETADGMRKAASDVVVDLSGAGGGAVAGAHLLGVVDRIVVPAGPDLSLLAWRQLRYELGFVLPSPCLSIGSLEAVPSLPLADGKTALLCSLSSPIATGLVNPSPELATFAGKLAAFRKSFAPYFSVYQHVLNYPDGKSIDGEAHLVKHKGFIILYNPTAEPRKTELPLSEPELELSGEMNLTDWSDLESSSVIGAARVGDKFELEIAPGSARIIGVNVAAPPK